MTDNSGAAGARNVTPEGEYAEWESWTWSANRGPNIPWLGVLLVLVGAALLIGTLVPAISTSTLMALGIAGAFLVAWIIGRSWFSMIFGLPILAIGLAELIEDLGLLGLAHQNVPGLWSISLAVAFLLIWLISTVNGRRSTWPLWGFAIFGLIGFAELSSHFGYLPGLGFVWPILIIVVGVVLLVSAWSRQRT